MRCESKNAREYTANPYDRAKRVDRLGSVT